MTQFLPTNLLALFAARDPIPFLPPPGPLSHERRTSGYTGVGQYLQFFETGDPPIPEKFETRDERHERKRKEKKEQVVYKLEQEIAMWTPSTNERATTDPFKTLFVGRVNFDTTESKLKREFESYGNIKKIVMVKDKKNAKPRGYAFVEFEHDADMHRAFKSADGKKIDGKRVLVDFERGRADRAWLPRRLGGGLGGTRRGGPDINVKISGREDQDRDRFRDSDDGSRRGGGRDRRERTKERESDGGRRRERSRDRRPDRVDRRRSKDRSDRGVERDRDKKDPESRKRGRRDEDRERDRSRKRSKSNDRKRHRSKSRDKDKKRDRKDRGDRDKGRDRGDRKDRDRGIKTESDTEGGPAQIKIKEEPKDDYPSFEEDYAYPNNYIKQEEDEDGENNHNNNHSSEY